jgi:hypothetical protein
MATTQPTGQLDTHTIHARLLPLALAAGHDRLTIMSEVGGPGDGSLRYQAWGSGGAAEFRFYVIAGLPGSHPDDFEKALEEGLQAQVSATGCQCQL